MCYHRDHVGRLLREAGWSRQAPIERATQRNEEAIKQWSEQRWSAIKKKLSRTRPPSTGRDEAGFYLLPMAVRTWAPCGQTPTLRVPLTRDHLSAGSSITSDGRLFMQVRPASYTAAAVAGGSRVCSYARCAGKIVVIWDGSPIHRGHEIKDFLKRGAAKRLHLEQLPGYTPDLNPAEGIWNYLKRVELGNVCWSDLEQLHRKLIQAKKRLRHNKEIINSCFRQCGYSV